MSRGERKRAVVVTGASSGIGRACALRLDRAGWRVFAGVRNDDDAESLRAEATGADLTPVRLEVTDEAEIAAAAAAVRERLGADDAALDALVNNAGIGVGGPLEHIALGRLRRQLEVNVVGQLAVTQAFLPLLRAGRGRIVNMSSVSGRFASPLFGPYCMSKYALEAMSDSLRRELRDDGIRVILIEPGAFESRIWEKARREIDIIEQELPPDGIARYGRYAHGMRGAIEQGMHTLPAADRVARVVQRALDAARPRIRYVVGGQARLGLLLTSTLPARLVDALTARGLRSLAKKHDPSRAPQNR